MKSTLVLDANVILRYLLADHTEHYGRARQVLSGVHTGEVSAYVPESVIAECVYVLMKVYGVPRQEVADKLMGVLDFRGIANEHSPILKSALRMFRDNKVDIVDCIVVATAEVRGWEPFSFDADLDTLGKT